MADLQDFSVVTRAKARIQVPRATISARVVDSNTGETITNFTGANAILFPEVLDTFTTEESNAFMSYIAMWIVQKRAGLI